MSDEEDADPMAICTGVICIRLGLDADGRRICSTSFQDGQGSGMTNIVEGLGMLEYAKVDLLERWVEDD